MKIPNKIIVILSLALCFVATTSITAQTGIFREDNSVVPDTLVGADTVYYELGLDRNAGDWPLSWDFSIVLTGDQISGTNTGTVAVQVSNDPPSVASPSWTELVDGSQDYNWSTGSVDGTNCMLGSLKHRRIRLVWSKSGTGTNSLSYACAFKKTSNRL